MAPSTTTNGQATQFTPPAHPAANRWEHTIRPYSNADVEKLRGAHVNSNISASNCHSSHSRSGSPEAHSRTSASQVLQPLTEHLCPGSLKIEYTLATRGANKLWELLNSEPFVPALGALSGNQAMQMVRAGLKAVYCSGWQVTS